MRNVVSGISAAIALVFMGTSDADAAKISGNFLLRRRCASGVLQ